MNYQQKRHHELILANGLRGPANEYKRLAEEARHITVVTRTLSQQVLGREDGTLEEVSVEIDKVVSSMTRKIYGRLSEGYPLPVPGDDTVIGMVPTRVIVDEILDTRYPARKKRRG